MSKNKKIVLLVLIVIIAIALIIATILWQKNLKTQNSINENTLAKRENFSGEGESRGRENMQGNAISKADDAELQAILNEVEEKFEQLKYEDSETGITLDYNLFTPDNYDSSKSYPLILFMTDSSVVGKETAAALEQGYGGVIWATEEEQAKHECFVLVPEFSTTIVNDNSETTDDIKAAVNLLNSLTEEYNIDKNRLYTTGQSMGGMTSIYLLKEYPDLFAGALLVACQWDTEGLEVLANQNIFYIVAEGDTKASPGQDEIKDKLEDNGATVSTATWDATWSDEEFNKAVNSILEEDNNLNFVKFQKETVLEANPISTQEHMASFDCAYKIEGVRDWLFEQSK